MRQEGFRERVGKFYVLKRNVPKLKPVSEKKKKAIPI